MIILPIDDDALLRECEIQTFRSGGKGGQNQNKVESGVRLIHVPTGLTAESREERSQYLNKMRCIKKLRRKVTLLNYRAPVRIATKTPRSVKEAGAQQKRHRSTTKALRRRPRIDD